MPAPRRGSIVPAMISEPIPPLDRRLVVILRTTVKELNLSARAYSRILIVARRIAECAQAKRIATSHLLEAIQFCTLRGDR